MATDRREYIDSEDFRSMIASSMDGFMLVSTDGYIREANQSYCHLVGYSREELLGMHLSEVDVLETAEDVVKRSEQLIRNGSLRFDTKHRHKDGSIIEVEVSSHYSPSHGGSFFSFFRDITQKKQVEETLMDEKALLRSIIDSASDLIYFKDCNSLYNRCNKASEKFIGLTEAEQVGKSDYDLFDRDIAAYICQQDKKVIEEGKTVRIEEYVTNHQGDRVLLDTQKTPIYRPDGQLVGLVGISRDITERNRATEERLALEQQLQQNQKLESLGVLAGGIAHDFNNLLAVIIGNCSLAKLRPAKALNSIPLIEKAAERAAELCKQMLAYAGKTQFVENKVNISLLVDEMVELLKSSLGKNVEITTGISTDIPLITADASQIRQIVMNLIINASEAIGDLQGKIIISLQKATIKADQKKDYLGKSIAEGRYVCLEITDSGCGMDDETKSRIFEPFFTTKFTGRGLGMSAVLGIITSHKGALQLFSLPDKGSIFRIYLPVKANDCGADGSETTSVAPDLWRGEGTVLLVEDEEQVMEVAKTMLDELGFNVITAINGKDALERYQIYAKEITLVITDIGMPVMDGSALIRELKKLKSDLPIIISTGFGISEVTSRIACEDMAGIVCKPYNFDKFRDLLKSVVERA